MAVVVRTLGHRAESQRQRGTCCRDRSHNNRLALERAEMGFLLAAWVSCCHFSVLFLHCDGIKKYRIIERACNGMEDMNFHGRTGNSDFGQTGQNGRNGLMVVIFGSIYPSSEIVSWISDWLASGHAPW
jgi:hypothetical protein